MNNKPDFYRPVNIEYIDKLNEAISDLSSEDYFRPLLLEEDLKFRIMSVESSVAVMGGLNNDPEHVTIKEMLSQSPACQQIAVAPPEDNDDNKDKAIKFIPIGKRLGKSRAKIEEAAKKENFKKTNGEYKAIRSISLVLKTPKEDQFLPPEFKHMAERHGATKFHETPQDITLGWLDLATETEEMTRRRKLILNSITSKIGFVLLGPIELGTI
jgi:hypothetical protein